MKAWRSMLWTAAALGALGWGCPSQQPTHPREPAETGGAAAAPEASAAAVEPAPSRPPRPSPRAPVPATSNEPLRERTYAVTTVGELILRGGSVGVTVMRLSDAGTRVHLGHLVLPGSVNGMVAVGPELVAVGCGAEGVFLVDLSNPDEPEQVGHLETNGSVWRLERQGDLVLAADGHAGLALLDLSQPQTPRELGRWRHDEAYVRHAVALGDHRALVAAGRGGVVVLDLTDPSSPALVGRLDTSGEARAVALRGEVAYVADFHDGLVAVDLSDPANPQELGRLDTADSARDVSVIGDGHLAVAMGARGVALVETTDPSAMRQVALHETALPATRFTGRADRLVVAIDAGGVTLLDASDPANPRAL